MDSGKGFIHHKRELPKLRDPGERIKDFKILELEFDHSQSRVQASRCMECGVPFCSNSCPIGNPIPNFNQYIRNQQWHEAIEALHATNNFPEFTGMVCPAPCESSCVLGINNLPVTIKHIELKIIEEAFKNNWVKPELPQYKSGKNVTIIGSGPAGLACAQQLNRAGHCVKIIEKSSEAGGLLRYGIPEYKLPKWILDRRLAILKQEGITFQYNTEVGKDISFEDIKKEADAVVLAIGAEVPRDLNIKGRESKGIYFAMEYLSSQHSINNDKIDVKEKKIIVIGGGDTGSDCIGTSLRQGAKEVTNIELLAKPPIHRSTSNPWPQYNKSYRVSTSMEENFFKGGTTEYQTLTKEFLTNKDGQCIGIRTSQVEWNLQDNKFEEVPNSEKDYECDVVFLALGYIKPKLETILFQKQEMFNEQGYCNTNTSKMTKMEGVFAAGDCRRGQSLIVWAIAEGRDTAYHVDLWLSNHTQLPSCDTSHRIY